VQTHVYDHSTFSEGLYGFVGRMASDACRPRGDGVLTFAGDYDNGPTGDEQPAFLFRNLRQGGQSIDTPFEFLVLDYDEDIASAFGLLEIVSLSIGPGTPAPRPRPDRRCLAPSVATRAPDSGCNPGGIGFVRESR
jgi:hypothetical protein